MLQPELDLPITASPRPAKTGAARWSTAIHEAGHVVVAVYYDLPIVEVCGDGAGVGWVQLDQEKIEPHLYTPACTRYLSKQVVMGYSGFLAGRKLNPEVAIRWRGGVEDWELNGDFLWWHWEHALGKRHAHRQLTEIEVEQILTRRARRFLLIAQRLVRVLFPVVQTVARALLERQRLTDDEVAALAGPLIAQERATWPARTIVKKSDYRFRVHPSAARMPRPKSFKKLGLKIPARCQFGPLIADNATQ